MTMKLKRTQFTIAALTAVVALLFATAPAAARHHGGGPHGDRGSMFHRILERLDLSEAQTEAMHAVFGTFHERTRPLGEEVRAAHRVLAQTMHADSFDEGAIRNAAADLATAEVEMAVTRARMFQEIRLVLTPEQQERAHQMIEDMQAVREEMHRGRGGHGKWSPGE